MCSSVWNWFLHMWNMRCQLWNTDASLHPINNNNNALITCFVSHPQNHKRWFHVTFTQQIPVTLFTKRGQSRWHLLFEWTAWGPDWCVRCGSRIHFVWIPVLPASSAKVSRGLLHFFKPVVLEINCCLCLGTTVGRLIDESTVVYVNRHAVNMVTHVEIQYMQGNWDMSQMVSCCTGGLLRDSQEHTHTNVRKQDLRGHLLRTLRGSFVCNNLRQHLFQVCCRTCVMSEIHAEPHKERVVLCVLALPSGSVWTSQHGQWMPEGVRGHQQAPLI